MRRTYVSMAPAALIGIVGLLTVFVLEVRPAIGEPTLVVFPGEWSADAIFAAAAASGVRIVSGSANRVIVVAENPDGLRRLEDNGALFSVNALGLAGCFATTTLRFGMR